MGDTNSQMISSLIGEIYEAAFVPEKWQGVLQRAVDLSGSSSGAVFLFSDDFPPRGECLEIVRPLFDEFVTGDYWKFCESAQKMCHLRPARFVHVDDFMTAEQIEHDPSRISLRAIGIGAHLCTAIPMPSGEIVTFVFQRWTKDGSFQEAAIDQLDQLRPHLARASMVAAQLRMERAETMVSALKAINLPAAVITTTGRVLAVNALLEQMLNVFLPLAFGRIGIANAAANALFQKALAQYKNKQATGSIPIPAADGQSPLVVHVLPLHQTAQDIFSGADILVGVTAVSASQLVPSPSLITSLFDLAPAEAKLAGLLTTGYSLKAAAAECGITIKSARTYLERIFRKTGCHQQSQLVALLRNTIPIHFSINDQN